ncbi:TOBE domain-containing protein, partial [Kaarinaea lacus]
ADHLALMKSGQVLASGPIGTMLTRMDLPLAHRSDAESVVEAQVSGHDEDFHLTHLTFPGGQFTVTGNHLKLGETVRLRILARDVSLTLTHQTDTSILNIFRVVVEEVMEENPSQMTIRVSAQGIPILSRITRKSATALGLEVGKQVYAQVKSVATLT